MYVFQEVHERHPKSFNTSHWRVISKETGNWIRYKAKGRVDTVLCPPEFQNWFAMTWEQRLEEFKNGERLPSMKIEKSTKPKENLKTKILNEYDYFKSCANKLESLPPSSLGNCIYASTPCKDSQYLYGNKEQGNNPMRNSYDSTSTSIAISATPTQSDESKQRDYLLKRLDELSGRGYYLNHDYQKIRDFYNMDVDNSPKTAEDLIARIKEGKYTLDPKKLKKVHNWQEDNEGECNDDYFPYSVWYGLEWEGPKPDHVGYEAAVAVYDKLFQDTRDTIMVGTPAEGLAALRAFGAWTPEQNAPSTTTVQ